MFCGLPPASMNSVQMAQRCCREKLMTRCATTTGFGNLNLLFFLNLIGVAPTKGTYQPIDGKRKGFVAVTLKTCQL